MKVISHNFSESQYYKEEAKKRGVVLHHTTSGKGVSGDIRWWEDTPEHVCTPIIIDRQGEIHRLYSSKFWGHHLGVKSHHFSQFGLPNINTKLNREFIGLEIDSWGGLIKRDNKYYSWTGAEVDRKNVVYYPNGFRGYFYYEKYTKEQIQAVKELLLYWRDYYNIDLTYKGEIMFEFNERALKGEQGIWSHVSFRPDKSDCHPQYELIEILKSL